MAESETHVALEEGELADTAVADHSAYRSSSGDGPEVSECLARCLPWYQTCYLYQLNIVLLRHSNTCVRLRLDNNLFVLSPKVSDGEHSEL